MFTRQHYKAIAEIINAATCEVHMFNGQRHKMLSQHFVIDDLADYFAKDDAGFDRGKFLTACGL